MSESNEKLTRLERLRKVAAENPESADAHLRLGTALVRAGLVRQAKDALEKAVEIDPKLAEAWINLGGVRFTYWDFAGCVEANQQAVDLDPKLTQAHYNKGLGHLYLNQPKDMVSCFKRVLEIDPENAGAHYHLAVGLHALGKTQLAQASLTTALELGHSPEPAFIKALTKKQEEDNTVQVLEFGPDDPKAGQ